MVRCPLIPSSSRAASHFSLLSEPRESSGRSEAKDAIVFPSYFPLHLACFCGISLQFACRFLSLDSPVFPVNFSPREFLPPIYTSLLLTQRDGDPEFDHDRKFEEGHCCCMYRSCRHHLRSSPTHLPLHCEGTLLCALINGNQTGQLAPTARPSQRSKPSAPTLSRRSGPRRSSSPLLLLPLLPFFPPPHVSSTLPQPSPLSLAKVTTPTDKNALQRRVCQGLGLRALQELEENV